MKKKFCFLLAILMLVTLFAGCVTNNTAKEDTDTITVYLWTTAMYDKYAPYVQSQPPDINIQFGDYAYDYTCTETLQSVSIPEFTSLEGYKWRTAYSDPASTDRVGLDDTVWPVVFDQMEQFIQDVNLTPDVLEFGYDAPVNMFANGGTAMIYGSSARVSEFRNQGIDTVVLPFFGQNGEQWLMTTPYLQVALNRDLEKNESRREKVMKVLDVMISEGGQTLLPTGLDVLSYSQDVGIHLTDCLKNLQPLIEQNHMYIRIASNDYFAVSKEVVSKMITGEYNAQQAYAAFDAQLRAPKAASAEIVMTSGKSYSNIFHSNGGSEAYSVMANSLREVYGSDVLIATGNSFTGTVLQADYTEKMVGCMIMPNGLVSFHRDMTGAELKETIKAYVEGIDGGFKPFIEVLCLLSVALRLKWKKTRVFTR